MALQDLTPQLRTRLRRVEKIVSLFVAVATLLLLVGFGYYLYSTAERKGWFIPKVRYHTYAMSAEGLNPGDPVMMMGRPVGRITVVDPQPPGSWYKMFVAFEILKPHYGYIYTDSKVKIAATGLLGARRLEVTPGYAGKPTVDDGHNQVTVLVQGKYMPEAQNPKGVFVPPEEDPALSERAQKLIMQVETALPNILSLTNQIATTLNNVALVSSNAVLLTAGAQTTISNVNVLLTDARPVVTNLAVITANIRDPHGSLGEWLIPSATQTQINLTLMDADNALNQLAYQLGLTLMNVANITSNLNTQVQTNDQILAEISKLVVDTDNMVQGLKRHWLLRGVFKKELQQSKTNAPARPPKK